MRALVFDGGLRLDRDRPDPDPAESEAVVRVRLAGICDTDLEIAQGYMGFQGVLGHEFVGEVVSAPAMGWVGRRVAGEINAACGICHIGNHCPHRTVLGILGRDGALAEYLRLPIANLHLLPDEVADEAAVFVEPLAAAYQTLESAHIRPSDRVLVLGDGKLGQLVARVIAQAGADVLVAGRHAEKLALLGGIPSTFATNLGDDRFDVVVDCTGSAAGFEAALAHTRPRGTLVLKSTVASGVTLNLAPIVIDEIRVVGSRCGPFPAAIRALAAGRIDPTPLLSRVLPLDDAIEAFGEAARPGMMKVAIRP